MANITPEYLRGFLIPSISISKDNLWDAQSRYSQANPRSGIPEAQSEGVNLTVSSIGTQSEEITLNTIQGGLPGDALFTWKGEDDIDLGNDAPHILTEAGYWRYSSSATGGSYFDSDCVSSLDGTMWVISESSDNNNRYNLSVRRQEKSGSITLINTFFNRVLVSTPSNYANPAITRLQDGSLLVAYFPYDSNNIKVHRSLDNGDTWKEIAPKGLNVGINTYQYTPVKMRMVSIDNTVVLFIELDENLNPNRLAQYVSRDGGTTFTLVDSISKYYDGRLHEPSPVALPDGSIGIACLTEADELHFIKIPSPGIRASSENWRSDNQYEINTNEDFALLNSDQLQDGNVTAWYHNGLIWVVAQQYGNGRLIAFYSEDFGVNWEYAAGNIVANARILNYGSNSDRLRNLSSCVHEGRAKIIGHHLNSVWMLSFGGYSSFCYPARSLSPIRSNYLRWETTYIPVVLPGNTSIFNTSGSGSQSLNGDGLSITTTGSTTRYYTTNHSGSYFTEGIVIRLRLQVDQNIQGVSNNFIALQVNQDNSINSTQLTLRFSTTTIQVRDSVGVKATITHDMTESTEIVIGITDRNAEIYYRTYDVAQAKKWSLEEISGITKGSSGLGNTIKWGHLVATGAFGTFQSHWQEVYIATGEEAGLFDFSLRGATYPPLGEYQYIDGGLAITAKDAPARGGDEYKITPRYDYGIENIFHKISLSPRVVWRSANQSFQEIPLFIDPIVQATEKSLGCSDMFGIHLANINFRLFRIRIWNGTNWNTFATVDTSADYTSTYIKKGNTLISNSSTFDFLLRYGEAIGWRARLFDPVSKDVAFVKIIMNSEGIWSTHSRVKQAVIQYDTSITDPSTIPANGEIFLMPDSVTFLKSRLDGVNLGQYAWMLEVSAQDRLEDYFQIGSMLMGSVAFPAPQYQRGRTITYSPNIQTQSSLDGMFFSRKMSAGRRTASIAWTEPIDPTRLNDLNPDYWQVSSTSGAQPVANYGDPHLLEGIFRYLNNREPLVYLPSIEKNPTNDQILLTARDSHMLCRTTGEITVESVLGEERLDEMFRVSTVNLEEIE